MAGNIKGLTIEIGGSTTKLTEALKEPQKETQSLRSKLKDIDGALKFNTSDVDLLNKKQRVLGQTIDSTENELKLLKQAQQEYIASGKDLDGEEYVALEKKIAITEKALENLKAKQSNFNGELQALGIKAGEFGEKTEALGQKFLPVTAGVTAVGAAATAAWAELDDAYDGIAAGTGATGDALKDLQASFDHVYGSFPADSAEVSTAIADLNTRFGFTDEQLEQCSTDFLQFAKVNGTDVSSAIALVSRAMGDAGVDASEYNSVLDALTAASQGSGLSVDKLAESLTKFGAPMRSLGFSMEESIALFSQWEKAGVNTDVAFSGMKKAISNWGKAGKDASVEFRKTLEEIERAPSIADATSLAIEAFGAKAGPDLADAIQGGRFSIEEFLGIVENAGGIVDQTFNDMQDPADGFQVALNNLKLAGADLGTAMQSVAAPAIEKLVEVCRNAAEWFKGLSDKQKEMIVIIGGIAAAIGPALIAIGQMSKGFSAIVDYFGKTTTMGGKVVASFKSLVGASSLGVGAFAGIAVAIGTLIGAFTTLWTTNEDFRNRMTAIWNDIVSKVQSFCSGIVERINSLGFNFSDITEVIKSVWMEFCDFLAPIFEGVWQQVEIALSTTLDFILGAVTAFTGLFKGDWDTFWSGIGQIIGTVWTSIGDTISNALNIVLGLISEFLSWFGVEWDFTAVVDTWNSIWQGIPEFLSNAFQTMQDAVSGFVESVQSFWDGLCTTVSETWTAVWTAIQAFGETTWNNISSVCQTVWQSITDFLSITWQSICDLCQSSWDTISNITSTVWTAISNFFSTIWTTIVNIFTTRLTNAQNNISTVWNAISSVTSTVWNAISSFMSSIWNTISSTISSLTSAISSTISSAWNAISSTTSSIFNSISSMISSIWNGIQSAISNVVNTVQSTVSGAWNAISSTTSSVFSSIQSTVSGIWEGIKNAIAGPIQTAQGIVADAIATMQNIINGAYFQLPHIALPHFSISGSFSLNPPSVPSLSIEWYAKAMQKGMILTSPTIFGMDGGKLLGGGEAGPEAIVGTSALEKMISNAVERTAMRKLEQIRRLQESPATAEPTEIDYEKMAGALLAGLSGVVLNNSVNIGLKPVVNEILPLIDVGLERRRKRR